ncbi:hypothetical protein [Weissella minor]
MKKLDLTKSKDVLGSFLTFDSSNIKYKYTEAKKTVITTLGAL